MNVRIRPIALVSLGLVWLAAVLNLMVGNVILRETRLGPIARFLDKMPTVIANPIFLLLWAIVLLGWSVPLVLGFRWLLDPKRSD
jgi:hypothetical protein